jgi:hypothetical protein
MKVKIVAEMACVPEKWMFGGKFEDQFDSVTIQEPDKIVFLATVRSYAAKDALVYDIEDHFNDLDVDYMSIEEDEL